MRVATNDGRRLHLVWDGPDDAPVIAFVNSLGTDLRLWQRFLPSLGGVWRSLRWDLAGHGLSEAMAGPCTIERHADDLAALLDQAGVRRCVVFGVSVGGQVALALASRRAELVRGLVLADTAPRIGDAASWNGRIALVREKGLEAIADAVMERWFPPAWRAANSDELALWRTMLGRQSADGYAATCEALRDADLTEATRALHVPSLVLAGLEDLATPPELVRGLAGLLPGARFVGIEGAGHLPMVDATNAVAGAVLPFLDSLPD